MGNGFGLNIGGPTSDIDGTEKAADGAPTGKRCCLEGGAALQIETLSKYVFRTVSNV